jgi:hypothetical protein
MDAAHALYELRHAPRRFLAAHYLAIDVGGACESRPAATVHLGRLRDEPAPYAVAQASGQTPTTPMSSSPAFQLTTNVFALYGLGLVALVALVGTSRADAVTFRALPELAASRTNAPDLLITPRLDGGAVAIVGGPDAIALAHVVPSARCTPLQIAGKLALQGAIAGRESALAVFAERRRARDGYVSSLEDATVIGVRTDTRWQVFAQVHRRGTHDVLRVMDLFDG